jgi:hypothetical protein
LSWTWRGLPDRPEFWSIQNPSTGRSGQAREDARAKLM